MLEQLIRKGEKALQDMAEKILELTLPKCPSCRSKDYSSQCLYRDGNLPEIRSGDDVMLYRTRNLAPIYKHSCNNCGNEWYC